MEIATQIIGILLLVGIAVITYFQLTHREFNGPGYLEDYMMADFEPDTRTNEERLAESRRLIDFELNRINRGE